MKIVKTTVVLASVACALALPPASRAQSGSNSAVGAAGPATFDSDGTAHIARVVPMPLTVSPEARAYLEDLSKHVPTEQTLAERRASLDKWRAFDSTEAKKLFPVAVEEKMIAGVRTDVITPADWPERNRKRVLINLHGGGFNADSGSLIEGIPIASLTKTRVVSVYYRLAPEHPFPAAVEDVVAIYKELLKDYKPASIGIFGTSAGGILTAEVAVQLKQSGLPMPGALGMFSILADYALAGDSQNLFTLEGLPGQIASPSARRTPDDYVGATDAKNPLLSPVYADLRNFPPSLLVTSTRDSLLSSTAIFHRALLRAGNDAQLAVYEALPHAFWYHFQLPETREALELMATFFDQKVAR
jgi:epsilon-lactone hydrolase